ncbi:MAG: cytochrome c biogenesis protein CcdA [Candidatus Omnitrophota bacterium]|jgi:thiol:disulfide interchange protein DsbD
MNLSGSPVDFLWVFFAGVLVSFTPCVYPLLPITIAYVGVSSANSKIKGFVLSLIYVTGVSITYTVLGLLAVLTGSIFGQFSTHPVVRIIVGAVIILFGLALFTGRGFRVSLLKLPRFNKSGTYLSCFILGITSGLVVSPCTAPVLGSILIFVATQKNFIYGGLLLFSFAYGMGLLLILAGTFSSILTNLPKSGQWMEVIMKTGAIILIIVGIYFAVSGIFNLAYAQEQGVETSLSAPDFTISDLDGNKITLSEFKQKQPVVLFFWTTWCPFCLKELINLNQIYADAIFKDTQLLAININESRLKVRRFLERYQLDFKILLDSDARVAYSYGVLGVPTFVLINKQGAVVFKDHFFPLNKYENLLTK